MPACATMKILSSSEWRRMADEHRSRAERFTGPTRERKDRGLPHPIEDFLFEYYPFPLALLEKWQPGIGVALEMDANTVPGHLTGKFHTMENGRVFADPRRLDEAAATRMARMIELLEATRDRTPNFACHGLHEWAMVFRGREVRHERTLRLRLPQEEIDTLVLSRPICCSHHDAFRFFAAEARPLNRLQPDLESRVLLEQPGCVHANMDLYKWAAKSMPWSGSDLLLDCFELALELRSLDMRASPYDVSEWGLEAVRIETREGRRLYEDEQKRLSLAAQPLRERLIDSLQRTLGARG